MFDRIPAFVVGLAIGILIAGFFTPMPLCESKYAYTPNLKICKRFP